MYLVKCYQNSTRDHEYAIATFSEPYIENVILKLLDLITYHWYAKIDHGSISDIGKMVCSLLEVVRLFKAIDARFKTFKKLILLYKRYNYRL